LEATKNGAWACPSSGSRFEPAPLGETPILAILVRRASVAAVSFSGAGFREGTESREAVTEENGVLQDGNQGRQFLGLDKGVHLVFYRLRKSLSYGYFKYQTRAIHKSAPIPCNPSGSCGVHTMLSAVDLPLYLVGIKSLLRFYNSMAVVVHSDGTLR